MTDIPDTPDTSSAGPTSERMQALLSQFAEEQVSEQRLVSTVLSDLRTQLTRLSEGVRLAASDASVERLGGVVSTVVADLRTSSSLLGQRIEALSKRVEEVAQDAAVPTVQAAARLAALQGDIAAQAEAVDRMHGALQLLAGFPNALAALQKDVAGLHDRVQPLAEIRSSIGDIGVRTASSLEALRPQLNALQTKVEAIGVVPDPERLRDSVVDALTGRLDRLEEAAARPVVGPEVLRAGLGDLRAALDNATGERLGELSAVLAAVEHRLGQVGVRLADVGDAAGGVPALSTDLTRLAARVEELQALHGTVAALGEGLTALREDTTSRTLALGAAAVREDLDSLSERLTELVPPSAEEVAAVVSQRVADRLVETLAPRIADVVLTRVSATLVAQLGEGLAPRLRVDSEAVVRSVTADSERRVLAHVDEAVLALAEALLRRRRGGRATAAAPTAAPVGGAAGFEGAGSGAASGAASGAPGGQAGSEAPAGGAPEQAVQDIVDKINAVAAAPDHDPEEGAGAAPAFGHDLTRPDIAAPDDPAASAAKVALDEEPAGSDDPDAVHADPGASPEPPPPAPARPSVTTGLAPATFLAAPVVAAPPGVPAAPAVPTPIAGPAEVAQAQAQAAEPVAPASDPASDDAVTWGRPGVGAADLDAEPATEEEPGEDLDDKPDKPDEAPEVGSEAQLGDEPGPEREPAEAPPLPHHPEAAVEAAAEPPEVDVPASPSPPRDDPDVTEPVDEPEAKPAAPLQQPVVKPFSKPILDRTPDLQDDDVDSVPSATPRPTADRTPQEPVSAAADRSAAEATDASGGQPPPDAPAPPPPPPPPPPAPPKRKPWWRPGG